MTAILAIAGMEWRLRRGQLGALALLAAAAAGWTLLQPGALETLQVPLVQAILFAWVVALLRTGSADALAAWSRWSAYLPLMPRPLLLGRLAISVPAASLGAWFYVSLAIPAGSWQPLHTIAVGLWLLLACGNPRLSVLALAWTLPTVVQGEPVLQGLHSAIHLLLVGAYVDYLLCVRGREWLPHSAPKEVRPVKRRLRLRRRDERVPRSPRAVLGEFVGVPDVGLLLVLLNFYYLVLFAGTITGGELPRGTLLVLLFGGAAFIACALQRSRVAWSRVRAYPVRRWQVWIRPLLWPCIWLAVMAPCVLVFRPPPETPTLVEEREWILKRVAEHQVPPAPISSGSEPMDPQRLLHFWLGSSLRDAPTGVVLLMLPEWLDDHPVLRKRPTGMPGPARGMWPLRRHPVMRQPFDSAVPPAARGNGEIQREDEAAYFGNAVRFYLHLVHGVVPTDGELSEALGEAVHVTESPTAVPLLHFVEHLEEAGSPYFRSARGAGAEQVVVEVKKEYVVPAGGDSDRADSVVNVRLYAFGPALLALQKRLEPKLREAARMILLLDCLVLALCLLAFVLSALTPGPLRWVWPALPLLAAAIWISARGTAGYLALRDLHLAQGGASVAFFLVLAALLGWAIFRRLASPVDPARTG